MVSNLRLKYGKIGAQQTFKVGLTEFDLQFLQGFCASLSSCLSLVPGKSYSVYDLECLNLELIKKPS